MIEAEGLTKRYGDYTAITKVTFSVAEGEVVGFLGPNAAGKTTTMRILTCFMPATSGTARIAGYDVFDHPMEVRRRIGYMPENVPLYTDMTVKSYLDFMAKVKRVDRKEKPRRIDAVMEVCGLGDFRSTVIGKLSKGYRQRVGLAQAMVRNPQVLILDEPTIGLDPRQIIEIRNLIKGLGGEHTVILSTHILPEASMICDRVIVINEGRIAGTVTLEDGRVATIESLTAGMVNLTESGNVYLQVRGPSDAVLAKLRSIPNASDAQVVSEADGVCAYNVAHQAGTDIRAELTATIVHSGWELLEVRPVETTLEEAFLELTREEVSAE